MKCPAARTAALNYEKSLDPSRRKQLGQFFTGVTLGKLLAHLALQKDTRTVLDPMAGHGDLLDATFEAASELAIRVERLDGIEIDATTADVCHERLAALVPDSARTECSILARDAFDPATVDALPLRSYDLVVTNPPYVRYQTHAGCDEVAVQPRKGLEQIIDAHCTRADRGIWKLLAQNYSGLADLSVPAWILSGLLVRPGGRLALVVPATWRSRNYADVIRYMLLRFFALETVVEDSQPGWFSNALVRTHLIVAKRLSSRQARSSLNDRKVWGDAQWLGINQDAVGRGSLVGAAFGGENPEAEFAAAVHSGITDSIRGIEVNALDLRNEWTTLETSVRRKRWYPPLEGDEESAVRITAAQKKLLPTIPLVLREMLPPDVNTEMLIPLAKAGIQVGQGLRTGCNSFFYVTSCGPAQNGDVRVKSSIPLGGEEFSVPFSALRPALRRQADMGLLERGDVPYDRVLDLRAWVLPEDSPLVEDASLAYKQHQTSPPRIMPAALAEFVRHASTISADGGQGNKLIPELSAVRTNVRQSNRDGVTPRFWYMIPDFAPRHLPAAFVPRVNHGTPWIERNSDPPLLIDANFSTFWMPNRDWTRYGMKALLNSIWCRCFMEASGTPLGGGALKLEATHVRQLLVPNLTAEDRSALDVAGRNLTRESLETITDIDRIVLQALFPNATGGSSWRELAARLRNRARDLCASRRRVAS